MIHQKSSLDRRSEIGRYELLLLVISVVGAWALIPQGSIGEKNVQDTKLTEALLRDVVDHMSKEFDIMNNLQSNLTQMRRHLALIRTNKNLENRQPVTDLKRRRRLHVRVFLHSSLVGYQYRTGNAGEGIQHLKPSRAIPNHILIKREDVRPAYCNPPNPCPVGYTEDQGCIIKFEDTPAFSREYQVLQRCMCDGEHMFSCPSDSPSHIGIPFKETYKGLVEKNFLPDVDINPILAGERLPIAAKKGFDMFGF